MTNGKPMNRKEAAHYLVGTHGLACVSETLTRHAHFGTGPAYVLSGNRALYTVADLDEWAKSRIKPASTKGAVAKRAEAEKAAAPRAA